MSELKRCPFCLADNYVIYQRMIEFSKQKPPVFEMGWKVRCGKCNVRTTWWHKREDAIKQWNTSSMELELKKEIERLKETMVPKSLFKNRNKEIEELIVSNSDLAKLNADYIEQIEKLKKENEELRKRIQEFLKLTKETDENKDEGGDEDDPEGDAIEVAGIENHDDIHDI